MYITTCTCMITGDTLPVLLKMCHWVTGYFPGQFHPPHFIVYYVRLSITIPYVRHWGHNCILTCRRVEMMELLC